MARIDMTSITSKVRAYTKSGEGKQRTREYIAQFRKEGKNVTEGGGVIINEEMMCKAAETMIDILKQIAKAQQLPDSVYAHFDSLTYTTPRVVGRQGDSYQVDIQFEDDLSRMSLLITRGKRRGQRTGGGIKNIVSLFDTGYSTSSSVFGVWKGHEDLGNVKSLEHRDGKWFMAEAIETFNRVWGEQYEAHAVISADPEFYVRI